MKCIEDCHEAQVIHGDIKTENCLVTSWNWLVLSDFASFKPTYIPDDDPTDFQFYFDSMNRRKCYLAPERFHKSSNVSSNSNESENRSDDGSAAQNIPLANSTTLVDDNPLHEILERDPSMAVSILRTSSHLISEGGGGGGNMKSTLTEAMDIFSLGCVIAEVSLDFKHTY